ncbi:MAG: hypothetical protein JWO20_713 [Candidatus Angelobacter sp.]|nr:hypothetical protein [Candidatus Angelobacter sp.]
MRNRSLLFGARAKTGKWTVLQLFARGAGRLVCDVSMSNQDCVGRITWIMRLLLIRGFKSNRLHLLGMIQLSLRRDLQNGLVAHRNASNLIWVSGIHHLDSRHHIDADPDGAGRGIAAHCHLTQANDYDSHCENS